MNNYKSQGQTFEESLSPLADGSFIQDPFFKQHLENIRKQRELGLGFDMGKAKKVVEDAVSGIDYSDLPEAIRNRTLVIDIDQVCAAHGADTAEQRGLSVCVDSFDTWNFKDFANIAKLDKPARDWEQGRLRRGKGHNKFKRKGKK